MHFFKAIWLGYKRAAGRFWLSAIFVFSTLWTIIESATNIIPKFEVKGWEYYALLILISLIFAIGHVYPRYRIRFKVGHSNTSVTVYFGDIFGADGFKA